MPIKTLTTRKIQKILESRPTIEGAGVKLRRAFGQQQVPQLDPFLLLDDFKSDNPTDYLPGFPWHPHRGIETITYILNGRVEHGDSIGNKGIIKSGEVQWMTAGSGIIHQEMPKKIEGTMQGFQLWLNLPGSNKMMDPRYRDVKSNQIPEVTLKNGVKAKIVAGKVGEYKGPVEHLVVDAEYIDLTIDPYTEYVHKTKRGYKVFAYVIDGKANFSPTDEAASKNLVIFQDGDKIKVQTKESGVRFLLISGKPLDQPVAWYGPIVMNTREELSQAFNEFETGKFIKTKKEQKEINDKQGEEYYNKD